MTSNTREAIYLALLASVKGEEYLSDALDRWKKKKNPTTRDFNFAQEIGKDYGLEKQKKF